MYKRGEGIRAKYRIAIRHFFVYLETNGCNQVHLELVEIFETGKGFTDLHRALYHLRIYPDMKRRSSEATNRRVASYFVRGTPPRRISLSHLELQCSLERMRKIHSQEDRNGSISTLFNPHHPAMNPTERTVPVDNRLSRKVESNSETRTGAAVEKTITVEPALTGFVVPEGYVALSITNVQWCIIALFSASFCIIVVIPFLLLI